MNTKDISLLGANDYAQIQNILQKYPLIKEKKGAALLSLCGLSYLESTLATSESAFALAATLIAELSKPHIKTDQGKPALFSLLVYVRATGEAFTQEEQTFLDTIILRYQTQSENKSHRQRSLRKTFASQRLQAKDPFPPFETPIRLNLRDIIITKYDLGSVMGSFSDTLEYKKAAAFVVAAAPYNLLRDYVLKRMQQEFERAIRNYPPIYAEVDLNQYDISTHSDIETLIEEKIKNHYSFARASDLITKNSRSHVILTVWNHSLPGEVLSKTATSFWQRIVPAIAAHLEKHKLCFVLILAHLPPEDQFDFTDDFKILQLPHSTEMKAKIASWVEGQLNMLNVRPRDIDYCLKRVSDPRASFQQIFLQLEHIVQYLQGTYDESRYDAKKQNRRKRTET